MILKDGSLDVFKGDLEDYRSIILGKTALQKKQTREVKQKKQTVKIEKKEMRQIRAEISKIEKRLERFQRKINEIDQELSSSDAYKKDSVINVQSLLRDKMEISGQIESLEEEWLKLNTKMDVE